MAGFGIWRVGFSGSNLEEDNVYRGSNCEGTRFAK